MTRVSSLILVTLKLFVHLGQGMTVKTFGNNSCCMFSLNGY
jgi:hypothetical protein